MSAFPVLVIPSSSLPHPSCCWLHAAWGLGLSHPQPVETAWPGPVGMNGGFGITLDRSYLREKKENSLYVGEVWGYMVIYGH